MADQREMQRLWNMMLQLEKTPVKTEADFNHKKKEMDKLKSAYDKAAGVESSPSDVDGNERRGLINATNLILGRDTQQPSRDELNK